jgi:hypothetical protein
MTIYIFQGLESDDHLNTLKSVVPLFDKPPKITVSVSYGGTKARRNTANRIEKVASQFNVVLDSGVANHVLDRSEALRVRDQYYEYVNKCSTIPGVFALQFQHSALTDDDNALPDNSLIIPVATDNTTLEDVEDYIHETGSIALPWRSDTRIPPMLRRLSPMAIALHYSDLESAAKAGYTAVLSGSWLLPGKFGKIIFWDGRTLHKSTHASARVKMWDKVRPLVDDLGIFDVELLDKKDSREGLRMAAWSYLSWSASLAKYLSDTESSVTSGNENESESASTNSVMVTTSAPTKSAVERKPLPVFGTTYAHSLENHPDGSASLTERPMLSITNSTVRVCDTCFLARQCPAYTPASDCSFTIPMEVRTDDQVKALLHSMVELQATRVAFARFAEEVNGGMPDPVVGQEMDRLIRMTDKVRKSDERRERLTVSVEAESIGPASTQSSAPSAGGVLSRIFGERAAAQPVVYQEPQARPADEIIGEVLET